MKEKIKNFRKHLDFDFNGGKFTLIPWVILFVGTWFIIYYTIIKLIIFLQ